LAPSSPHPPRIETINDADCYVANFWRATSKDPEAVAEYADGPVNEAGLHAQHRWLVLSDEAKAFRERMRREPDYFDAKVAGWWCWGLCCWIGGGWCTTPADGDDAYASGTTPAIAGRDGKGLGVHRSILLGGGEGQLGHGVHAKGERPEEWNQVPLLASFPGTGGKGVHVDSISDHNRPQLADAFSRGRGVHNDNHLPQRIPQSAGDYGDGKGVNQVNDQNRGICAQRRAWLLDWFGRLRDRLRTVRVCCGDWLRVCDSESVTTRLGVTGIFFDPPYGHGADRDSNLYATDCLGVAAKVRAYCLERGGNPKMRICLAGYAGEGHEELEAASWSVVEWQAQGGYGNRSAKGKENAKKERLWFSPHCAREKGLFG